MNQLKVYVVIIFVINLIIAGCASTKSVTSSFVGTWDYTVYDTPEGDMTGKFVINQVGDEFKGKFKMSGMSLDMEDLKIADNKLTAHVFIQGYRADLRGEFAENTFKGVGAVEYNEFRIEAIKSK